MEKLSEVCANFDSGLQHAAKACESHLVYLRSMIDFLNKFFNKACRFRGLASEARQAIEVEVKLTERKLEVYKASASFQANFKQVSAKPLSFLTEKGPSLGAKETEEFRFLCLESLFRRFETSNRTLKSLLGLEHRAAQLKEKAFAPIVDKLSELLQPDSPEFYAENGIDIAKFTSTAKDTLTPNFLGESIVAPAELCKPRDSKPEKGESLTNLNAFRLDEITQNLSKVPVKKASPSLKDSFLFSAFADPKVQDLPSVAENQGSSPNSPPADTPLLVTPEFEKVAPNRSIALKNPLPSTCAAESFEWILQRRKALEATTMFHDFRMKIRGILEEKR